ncbi:MAG: hypothetical protein E6767_16325 [Dysgonomonas sp.]|nr:hypothetical protein [Dysgonomonas sp.]
MWALLISLIALAILRYIRKSEGGFDDFLVWIYMVVFMLVCCIEIGIGYIAYHGYEIYFFGLNQPSDSIMKDISMVVTTGSIFIFLVYNQLKSLLNLLSDLEYNSSSVSYTLYVVATIVGLIGGLIVHIFYPQYLNYVIIGWGICTVIQVIMIMKATSPQIGYGICISLVLIVGSLTCIGMTVLLIWAYLANRLLKLVTKFDIDIDFLVGDE